MAIEFEMDGVWYRAGVPSPEEEAEIEYIDADPDEDPDEDPESWRQYADNFNAAQIAWLKKHPEHDWSGELDQLRAKGLLTEEEIRFIDSRPGYKDLNPD